MDKTFAAVTGNVVTDWPLVIERLDTMGVEEHDKYRELAWDWPTCAVGNACAIIPRTEPDDFGIGGSPLDTRLHFLGVSFGHSIASRDKPAALTCWKAIEARAAVVVAQELAKLNAP